MSMTTPSTPSDLAHISGDGYLTGTSCFPQELLLEVLLQVPVKPLLRFRCVSKSWCSLIDNTAFGLKHLEKSIECNPNSGIIVREFPNSEKHYLVDVELENEFTAVEIGSPLKNDLSHTQYVGSCNGLVCLWTNDKSEDDIFLWNSATRKIRKLPRANNIPIPFRLIGSCGVGFGYDHVNDDYKVMRTYDSQIYNILVSVYSLKSNTWTRADTISNRIRIWGDFGVYANGSLYWLEEDHNIFAFDLGVHRHKELSYPAGVDSTGENGIGLVAFNRCLCLINECCGSGTDLWLMNNDGEEYSWSKMLSLEQPGILGSYKILHPLAFSKTQNDLLLSVDEDKLVWFDHGKNKIKTVKLHGFPHAFD